jgi:phosphoribosyl 1,2-cyclic phosphodiesterase
MVRFTVLASGSRGNATVVTGGRTRILIDCGLSCRELFRRMRLVEENPESLDAILITHEHADHVNGVAVTARKLGIPVFFTEATHRAWVRWLSPRKQMTYAQWMEQMRQQAAARKTLQEAEALRAADVQPGEGEESAEDQDLQTEQELLPVEKLDEPAAAGSSADATPAEAAESLPADPKKDPTWLPAVEYFQPGEQFSIGDITVNPFTTPHDAADPCGFVFRTEGLRLGYATDLGYLPPNVKAQLKALDLLLLESNHDLEMLRDGPYPWAVKQRVLSRVGHLSNEATASFLENDYDGGAAYVILAHLSESNNLPDLARMAAEKALAGHPGLLGNRLLLARQDEPLSSVYF